MATPAIVGVRRGDGWEGTFVGYDGVPEFLGEKILDLVFAHAGDLRAAWSTIAAAPDGWRFAFTEPYERGFNREYFDTGRTEPPLLSDRDAFVRENTVYWFIFDLEARALEVHRFHTSDCRWSEVGRLIFSPDGHPAWRDVGRGQMTPEYLAARTSVNAWAAAMEAAYDGASPHVEQATIDELRAMVEEALPLQGPRTELFVHVEGTPTLTLEGLVCPFYLVVRDEPDPSNITAVFEHDGGHLLFPRRTLWRGARCRAALRAALEAIARELELEKVPTVGSAGCTALFSALFPLHLVEQPLDEKALTQAIKAEVAKAFRLAGA